MTDIRVDVNMGFFIDFRTGGLPVSKNRDHFHSKEKMKVKDVSRT